MNDVIKIGGYMYHQYQITFGGGGYASSNPSRRANVVLSIKASPDFPHLEGGGGRGLRSPTDFR
jgi:hypothetical protein